MLNAATYFTVLTYLMWNFPILKNVFGDSSAGQRFFYVCCLGLTGITFLYSSRRLDRSELSILLLFLLALAFYSFAMITTTEAAINIAEGLGRTVVYLCGFLIGIMTARNLPPERFLIIMKHIFWLNLVFCLFPLIPGGAAVIDFFKGRTSDDFLAALHYFRWTGTFAYPTDFSFYLILVMLMVHFHRDRFTALEATVINGFALLAILLSVSRIGIAAVVVVLVAMHWRRLGRFAIGGAVAVLLGLLLMPENQLEYIRTGFALGGKLDASAMHRANELGLAFDPDHLSMLGYGPRDEQLYRIAFIIEGWLPYQLLTWGLAGFAFAIFFFMCLFVLTWPAVKVREPWTLTFWTALATALLLFGPFSAVIDRFKMPFLLFSLLGMAVAWGRQGAATSSDQRNVVQPPALRRV